MVRVQAEPFDVAGRARQVRAAGGPISAAVASFVGLVRDEHGGRPVTAMTLEHYPGMTERQLAAPRGRGAAPLAAAGQPASSIGSAGCCRASRSCWSPRPSAHRRERSDACAFLIDWLKTEAPFWKLEETPDGERWVEAGATTMPPRAVAGRTVGRPGGNAAEAGDRWQTGVDGRS